MSTPQPVAPMDGAYMNSVLAAAHGGTGGAVLVRQSGAAMHHSSSPAAFPAHLTLPMPMAVMGGAGCGSGGHVTTTHAVMLAGGNQALVSPHAALLSAFHGQHQHQQSAPQQWVVLGLHSSSMPSSAALARAASAPNEQAVTLMPGTTFLAPAASFGGAGAAAGAAPFYIPVRCTAPSTAAHVDTMTQPNSAQSTMTGSEPGATGFAASHGRLAAHNSWTTTMEHNGSLPHPLLDLSSNFTAGLQRVTTASTAPRQQQKQQQHQQQGPATASLHVALSAPPPGSQPPQTAAHPAAGASRKTGGDLAALAALAADLCAKEGGGARPVPGTSPSGCGTWSQDTAVGASSASALTAAVAEATMAQAAQWGGGGGSGLAAGRPPRPACRGSSMPAGGELSHAVGGATTVNPAALELAAATAGATDTEVGAGGSTATGSDDDGADMGSGGGRRDGSPSATQHTVVGGVVKRSRKAARQTALNITYDQLSVLFSMPIHDAAARLGVGLTLLKRVCRAHGIKRWPFRQVQSLETLIEHVASQGAELQRKGYSSGPKAARTERCLEQLRSRQEALTRGQSPMILLETERKLAQRFAKIRHLRRKIYTQTGREDGQPGSSSGDSSGDEGDMGPGPEELPARQSTAGVPAAGDATADPALPPSGVEAMDVDVDAQAGPMAAA